MTGPVWTGLVLFGLVWITWPGLGLGLIGLAYPGLDIYRLKIDCNKV